MKHHVAPHRPHLASMACWMSGNNLTKALLVARNTCSQKVAPGTLENVAPRPFREGLASCINGARAKRRSLFVQGRECVAAGIEHEDISYIGRGVPWVPWKGFYVTPKPSPGKALLDRTVATAWCTSLPQPPLDSPYPCSWHAVCHRRGIPDPLKISICPVCYQYLSEGRIEYPCTRAASPLPQSGAAPVSREIRVGVGDSGEYCVPWPIAYPDQDWLSQGDAGRAIAAAFIER
ncbi:hypothetical protein F4780DRAFT_374814 [Xylariomycetidae sp. FL0641]|nr:hypothetical protein F4780DRAFT_374814 [Xylariomycetidae sp. FL0641]